MSLERLRKEWNLTKFEIENAKNEEKKHEALKYAKSVYETALELYGVDLYKEEGGI